MDGEAIFRAVVQGPRVDELRRQWGLNGEEVDIYLDEVMAAHVYGSPTFGYQWYGRKPGGERKSQDEKYLTQRRALEAAYAWLGIAP